MDSTFGYVMQGYWDENGDPSTSQFFGMRTPWLFFAIGFNMILFCKYFGPKIMENKKPIDLRPLMIVLNGCAFGAYTAGVIGAAFVTDFYRECFNCHSYDPHSVDLQHMCIRYLGYLMIWTKVYDFLRPVLCILAKKEDRVTNLQLIHLQVTLMMTWGAIKLNPGGPMILVAICDTLYQLLVYGYLVMAASSPEMKPSPSFRRVLLYFREISIAVTFVHQMYFLHAKECQIGPFPLTISCTIYAVFHTILYPIDYLNRLKSAAKVKDICSEKSCEKEDSFSSQLDANKNSIK